MYKIEKDIPFQFTYKNRESKYPFSTMEVGDSFEFDAEERNGVGYSASVYPTRSGKKEVKFLIRKINGTKYRCWRITSLLLFTLLTSCTAQKSQAYKVTGFKNGRAELSKIDAPVKPLQIGDTVFVNVGIRN